MGNPSPRLSLTPPQRSCIVRETKSSRGNPVATGQELRHVAKVRFQPPKALPLDSARGGRGGCEFRERHRVLSGSHKWAVFPETQPKPSR